MLPIISELSWGFSLLAILSQALKLHSVASQSSLLAHNLLCIEVPKDSMQTLLGTA